MIILTGYSRHISALNIHEYAYYNRKAYIFTPIASFSKPRLGPSTISLTRSSDVFDDQMEEKTSNVGLWYALDQGGVH